MNQQLQRLASNIAFTGDIAEDAQRFMLDHGHPRTAEHSLRVAAEARKLALRFGEDAEAASAAGHLHDVSVVIPNAERIAAARAFGIGVLPEEEQFPLIVHQKLSAVMAAELFNVRDERILNAIGCHTTLKSGASNLDQVVFTADKIEWDQLGQPPYIADLLAALDVSLASGTFTYLEHMWDRRDKLKVLHPWLADAYHELAQSLAKSR